MTKFVVGSVVQLYERDPFEMISWRSENGNLCSSPPECEITVERVDEEKWTFTGVWFVGTTLYRDDFSMNDFHLVR